jgi:toxin ParE1/3/4
LQKNAVTSGFKVLRSTQCDEDLEAVFDHLFEACRDLGDDHLEAFTRAVDRVRGIEDALAALGDIPLQGTLLPDIMTGLRHVTKNSAVFYFLTDKEDRTVRVLAAFFSGQDHKQRVLLRLMAKGPTSVQ